MLSAAKAVTSGDREDQGLIAPDGVALINGREATWLQDSSDFEIERALFALLGGLMGGSLTAPAGMLAGKAIGLLTGGPPGARLSVAVGGIIAFIIGGVAGGRAAHELFPLYKSFRELETEQLTPEQLNQLHCTLFFNDELLKLQDRVEKKEIKFEEYQAQVDLLLKKYFD